MPGGKRPLLHTVLAVCNIFVAASLAYFLLSRLIGPWYDLSLADTVLARLTALIPHLGQIIAAVWQLAAPQALALQWRWWPLASISAITACVWIAVDLLRGRQWAQYASAALAIARAAIKIWELYGTVLRVATSVYPSSVMEAGGYFFRRFGSPMPLLELLIAVSLAIMLLRRRPHEPKSKPVAARTRQASSRALQIAALLTAVAAGGLGLPLWLSAQLDRPWVYAGGIVVAFVPAITFFWKLRGDCDRFWLGAATAFFPLLSLLCLFAAFATGLVLLADAGPGFALKAVPFLALSVLGAIGSWSAVRESSRLRKSPASEPGRRSLGALAALVFVAAGLQISYDLNWRLSRTTLTADQKKDLSAQLQRVDAAHRLVNTVATCAFAYRAAHPREGYPASLAAMGPAGTDCLTPEQAGGILDGYEFEYLVSGEAGERHAHFLARAMASERMRGSHAPGGFLVDDSGIVGRIASTTEIESTYTPELSLLYSIANCLQTARKQSASGEVPASLLRLLSIRDPGGMRSCLKEFEARELPMQSLATNHFPYRGYEFTYEPSLDAAGKLAQFTMQARVMRYGQDHFRSYFVDEKGTIHATAEDRAATVQDPPAPECEIGSPEPCDLGEFASRDDADREAAVYRAASLRQRQKKR